MEERGITMTFLEAQKSRLLVIGVLMFLLLSSVQVNAKGKATLITDPPEDLLIENKEGRKAEYGSYIEQRNGDMVIHKEDYEKDPDQSDTTGMWEIITDDSDEFTFKPLKEKSFDDFYIHIRSGIHTNKIARALWCEKITMTKTGMRIIGEKGSTCTYYIGMYKNSDKTYYNVDGKVIGNIAMYQDGKAGIIVEGAKGRNVLTLCSDKQNNKVIADSSYYLYGGKVRIVKKGKSVVAMPGVKISKKKTNNVTSLYLRPTNKGKNMFLSWNKVKGAQSYIVYKYSPIKNEYVKAAVRDSHNANYYNIPNAKNDIGHKYKVVAKTKEEGKGKKIGKDSYAVWAVSAGNSKGNVTSITTNKKKVTAKIGKSIKLIATVKNNDKKVLSKTIRWYSSNKKVALVDKNTGKVKFKKKGKCDIWAKAHNGLNSKKIKVTVK